MSEILKQVSPVKIEYRREIGKEYILNSILGENLDSLIVQFELTLVCWCLDCMYCGSFDNYRPT